MTGSGKQQRRAEGGDVRNTASGRAPRGQAPSAPAAGRNNPNPGAARAPQGQRNRSGASDDEERLQDIGDEEEEE